MNFFSLTELYENENAVQLLRNEETTPKILSHNTFVDFCRWRKKNYLKYIVTLFISILFVYVIYPLALNLVTGLLRNTYHWSPSDSTFAIAVGDFSSPQSLISLSEKYSNYKDSGFRKLKPSNTDQTSTNHHNIPQWNQQAPVEFKEKPIILSQHSKIDNEGERILNRDNEMCNRSAVKKYDPLTCLGPPYIYVTFHGGFNDSTRVKNICRYTRDGCGLGAVLYPNNLHTFHSLRGLLLLSNGSLIVTEAWKMNSRILMFSDCNPNLRNSRELVNIVIDANTLAGEGVIHPYGLAKTNDDAYLFISAQGTSSILRYSLRNGDPASIPYVEFIEQQRYLKNQNIVSDKKTNVMEKGTSLREFDESSSWKFYHATFIFLAVNHVRGIEVDIRGNLYVANKNQGLMLFNPKGIPLTILDVKSPISVHYCTRRDTVWVGSSKKHSLYEFNATTWERVQRISHPLIQHPSGIVSFQRSLFVISQAKKKLLKFSMDTGKLESVVLSGLIDAGEHVLLSNC